MKARHQEFSKKGAANLHDQTGRSGGICPKCKASVPPKPGFRVSSLKCPKCGAAMGKP